MIATGSNQEILGQSMTTLASERSLPSRSKTGERQREILCRNRIVRIDAMLGPAGGSEKFHGTVAPTTHTPLQIKCKVLRKRGWVMEDHHALIILGLLALAFVPTIVPLPFKAVAGTGKFLAFMLTCVPLGLCLPRLCLWGFLTWFTAPAVAVVPWVIAWIRRRCAIWT